MLKTEFGGALDQCSLRPQNQAVAGSIALRMLLVRAYQSTNSSGIWVTQIEGTSVAFIHTFVHLIKTSDPKLNLQFYILQRL